MDWSQAQKEMSAALIPLYGQREAAVITDWVMEALSGRKKLDRLTGRTEALSPELSARFQRWRDELLAYRPVQYVLRESWFAGMKFYVDERVLIPRPETEELVEWVVKEPGPEGLTLLDIGTGSGCIAVTLSKKLPLAEVHACDISDDALEVARRNARQLNAGVTFHQLDFLDEQHWAELPAVSCLVSNPPYVPLREKGEMDAHVVNAEPALALFVPDDDALVFYRALGAFARQRLKKGGALFAEIHEERGDAVRELLMQLGATEVHLRKDMQGKNRMIKAIY